MTSSTGTSMSQDDSSLHKFEMTEAAFEMTTNTESPHFEMCGEFYCPDTDIHTAIHIAAMLLFGLFGCSANCISIFIYSTKAKYVGNRLYILLLTYFDMAALLFNLPQYLFLKYIPCCVLSYTFFWPYNVLHALYIATLTAMAIERLVAVVSPFQFEQKRKMIKYLLISFFFLWLSVICARLTIKEAKLILRQVNMMFPLICVTVLACIYLIIIIKLLQQSKKGIGKASSKVKPSETTRTR